MVEPRVVGVLLAAGRAERFGGDKLIAALPAGGGSAPGTPVAVAAARTLITVLPGSVAVVRPAAGDLATQLRDEGIRVLTCPWADDGMGASLAFGVAATADADAWVIALADMPWIAVATIRKVAAALVAGAGIAVPVRQGVRGHPVGFGARFREALLTLSGDQGARAIVAANAADTVLIEVADPNMTRDVDTPEDLAG